MGPLRRHSLSQEEISRIRHFIASIKVDTADLNEAERAQMGEAVAVIRRHPCHPRRPLGTPTPPNDVRIPLIATTTTSEAAG
jgi:hypothetical protein